MPGPGYSHLAELNRSRPLERCRAWEADAEGIDDGRRRIELQIGALLESSGELERRAGEAAAAGRADLAREALDRMTSIQAELSGLRTQYQSLQEHQDKLIAASQKLQAKIDAVRLGGDRGHAAAAGRSAAGRPGEPELLRRLVRGAGRVPRRAAGHPQRETGPGTRPALRLLAAARLNRLPGPEGQFARRDLRRPAGP